jgi:hypothetical protein
MSDIIIGPDQAEMLLTYEVTDEALETAAASGPAAIVTINYWTYFAFLCPHGWYK